MGKSLHDNAIRNYPSVNTTSEFVMHFSQYICETSDKCGKAAIGIVSMSKQTRLCACRVFIKTDYTFVKYDVLLMS